MEDNKLEYCHQQEEQGNEKGITSNDDLISKKEKHHRRAKMLER